MRLRRLLALLLTLSTLVSIIPAAVFAAETDEGAGNEAGDTVEETVINAPDNLFMDKTVVLNNDGTYSINLEAYATGSTITKTITEGVPLDVVLVMDQSGSLVSDGDLLTGLKSSVTTFLEALRADGEKYGVNHRVAICGFASYGKQNSSGLAQDKFTFANDTQDNAWINTGIFVNGEFRDYGTVEYIPVDDETSISTGNYYVIDYDSNDDEILEKVTVFYYKYNGMWVTSADNEDGYIVVAETTQELREKYNVYQVGNSQNLLTNTDYANAWENISDGQGGMNKDVSTAVENLASNGATAIFMGMKMARKMLENLPAETAGVQRKKVVIVFTDGEPGFAGYTRGDGDAALAEAAKIKEGGTEIYAVGLYANAPSANAETFMNRLSSNYKSHNFGTTTYSLDPGIGSASANDVLLYSRNIDGTQGGVSPYFCIDENGNYWPVYIFYDPSVGKYYGYTITDSGEGSLGEVAYALENHVPNSDPDANYYKHASDIGELSSIFQTISSEVTDYTSQLTLDATAILMDVLGEGFTFTDNTKITVSVVPGSVSEENSGLAPEELTSDKITWDKEVQEVLSFTCREASERTGEVTVNGAIDQTKMTITAKVADGAITVTGFNYSAPTDEHKLNAQYINVGHPGSKLVVNVTGVEATTDITTNAAVDTNQDTSGIYEGAEYDADGDGNKGELQVPFAVPDTYLTSEYYYLNENNSVTINPADFLMGSCLHVDADGYHYFTEAGFDTKYGTVTVNEDGTITYTLEEGAVIEKDVFYLFGKTEDATVTGAAANKDGYMWSKITIYPPKNVEGNLYLDKSASLKNDGTYTIDLEAFATGTPATTVLEEGIPLDVVLLIDQSGSLMLSGIVDELQGAVSSFVNELKINGEAYGVSHRVSVATYASAGTDGATGFLGDGFPRSESPEEGTNRLYPHWYNTGLFVNGKFKNYGTLEYIPVESVEAMGKQVRFLLDYDYEGDGIWERWVTDTASPWRFRTYKLKPTGYKNTPIKDANGKNITTNQALFDNYKLYTAGAATCTLTDDDYKEAWEYLAVGENGSGALNEDISRIIGQIASSGGTRTSYGMKMAAQLIKNCPDDGIERKKIVIVFSDGAPGQNSYNEGDAQAALAEAKKIKNAGIEIYTVGVYPTSISDNAEIFMDRLSSNYSDHTFSTETTTLSTSDYTFQDTIANAKLVMSKCFYKDGEGNYWPVAMSHPYDNPDMKRFYYITDEGEVTLQNSKTTTYPGLYTLDHVESDDPDANYFRYTTDTTKLEGMFKNIVKEATTVSSTVTLDASSILKDMMADGFTLTGNTKITVSVLPGSVKEEYANLSPDELTETHISWDAPQQVLTFAYPTKTSGTGTVIVNNAADQTEMTITATASEDGTITVTGFNYANPTDNHKENAQYICAGHPGSKLMVTITGVEAKNGVVTNSITGTNKGTSGIYEAPGADADNDGVPNELQASFPLPTTYLTSKTYYVDYSGKLIIDPVDFLMNIKGLSLDKNGYHGFGAPGTTIELDHGTVIIREDGKLEYTMRKAGLDGTDVFYLFGTTNNATIKDATANANGNMWSKITVITPEDITGKLFLNKEATLTGDGTYTIDLNAYATGTPAITTITEGVPLDVVLVLDQSGSLAQSSTLDDLQAGVSAFIEELQLNGAAYGINHRVSIAGFASGGADLTSSIAAYGFTNAYDSDEETGVTYYDWCNTGLFIDGVFKRYGTVDYKIVEPETALIHNNYTGLYFVDGDGDLDGKLERFYAYWGSNQWRYLCYAITKNPNNNNKTGYYYPVMANTDKELLEKHTVYRAQNPRCVLTTPDYINAWEDLTVGENGSGALNPDIVKAMSRISANGATRTFYGMRMASNLIANAPKDDGIVRKKIVVVFTDGKPGYDGYAEGDAAAALGEAKKIKEAGAEIYTIGVYANATVDENTNNFMKMLSSNYDSHQYVESTINKNKVPAVTTYKTILAYRGNISKYFYKDGNNYWPVRKNSNGCTYITDVHMEPLTSTDYLYTLSSTNNDQSDDIYYQKNTSANLEAMFKSVVKNATTTVTVTVPGVDLLLKDVMADDFKLTDNTTITVSVVPGSVSDANSNIPADELTADKITWGEAQQVLSFNYPTETEKSGNVIVNGAADQTKMTITANATANGEITVTGFNYAGPQDPYHIDAQYIQAGHPGSKLMVTITGVEAQTSVVTDSTTTTNKGASGIYEAADSDMDEDGDPGEILATFPVPTTYLTSEYYYLDENNSVTFHPKDFLMTVKGINANAESYHYFSEPGTVVETDYGTITVNANGTVTYQLTNDEWKNQDVFYLFGTTKDTTVTGTTANKNGNMWSKITILPPKDASGKLHLNKEATLIDNGTYTINLEAFATGAPVSTTIIEGVHLNASAILKDVMADGFVMTNKTTITVSVVPGSVKEEYANLTPHELTADHINWGGSQQVLTFAYPAKTSGTGKVIVTGAVDQTQMSITAKAAADGTITVTGFNYASPADNHKENAQYICAGHPGSKLVVTITGVEAQSNVVTDSVTVTNKGTSGIYEDPKIDMDGDGKKGGILASFPIPTTYMASKVYVVDYAKTMTINPSDFQMTVSAVSVDVDGYNHFDPAVTAVTGTYGKVAVEGGKITYTPTRTNWNGYDSFYVFGTTDNATIKAATANENGNMWAKVSVVPANNVYYEDTFVTNESTGVVGIVFGGVWEEVKEPENAGSNGENAESGESTTKDDQGNDHQGGVHGWEDNLADDTGFSDGSAHVAGTDGKTGATATFTFTGTGVDIYSRTNDKTGMVIAMLYEGTSTTGEDGKNLVAKYSLMVDNLAASGDYYQIPTLSFCQIPAKDENGKIIKDENGNTQMVPLPHGTYTVKITVSKANASQTGEVRTLYYLDGIRVYNPIQDPEGDSTVSGAYGEKELNANFVEIRDKLLDANSFSAEDAESAGPVFIDRITSADGSHTDNTKTVEIGTYKVFGPKNEVYLSANQIVAFAVPYTEGAHYYIGMKSLTGKTVKVIPNSTDDYVNLIVVGHTTDQYYEIIPEWEYDEHGNPTTGVIYVHADITNGDYKKDEDGNYITDENGNYITEVDGAGAILALTKLKVTGPKAKNFKFARVSNSKLLEMIAEDLAPSLDMDDTNSSPDVGGNTPNKPNVDINKPSSDTTVDEQTALKNLMIDLLTRIFSDLRGWFKS